MIYTYFILLNTKGEISETKMKAFLGNTPYLCGHNFDQSNLDLFFNLFIKNLNQKIMKKILTLIAAVLLSTNLFAAEQIEGGIGDLVVPKTYENIGAWGGTWSGNSVENEKDWTAYEYVWIKYSEFSGAINFGVMYNEFKSHEGWGDAYYDATVAIKEPSGVIGIKLDQTSTYTVGTSDDPEKTQYVGDVYAKHIREIFIQATTNGSNITIEEMWLGTEAEYNQAVEDNKYVDTNKYITLYENDGTDLTTVMTKYFKNYVASEGEDGAIVVESLDPEKTYEEYDNAGADAKLANNWDTQFLIGLPKALPKGLKFKLSMKMKADKAAGSEWQAHHNMPAAGAIEGKDDFNGTYLFYTLNIDNYNFTTEWPEKPFEATITVPDDADQMDIICLNLEVLREVNKYYFKDIEVSVTEEDYENYLADPLKAEKEALAAAIAIGKAQNGFGKTAESFGELTSALEYAEGLDVESADKEKLVDAANAINEAIDGFVCADGYTKLTADMFKKWDDNVAPTTAVNSGCDYNVNVSTGQPYGASTVNYLTFADISEFNEMILFATEGTPRIMMNREVPELKDEPESETDFKDPNGGAYVQLTNGTTDSDNDPSKYEVSENKYTVKLTAYPYAHVNAIKGANWANVTVTDMLLYRFISFGEAGWASFGSNYKSAKIDATVYAVKFNSETGKMDLTVVEDGIVPAGAGVIIEGTSEVLPQFDVEAADAVESDLLISNGTVKGDGESIYVLAKKGEVVGFYLLTKDEVIPAGKAYYKAPAGDGARAFIALGGDVTGIKTVESVKAANNAIYNLAGQRLVKAQKGLNIVNGKKIMK